MYDTPNCLEVVGEILLVSLISATLSWLMAIIKSAKKAIKVSERRQIFNVRRNRTMKSTVKEVRELAASGKGKEARSKLSEAYKAIDKAAKRGIIKKNTASRKKSRLSNYIKKKSEK